jgi:transcriptional regulator with XRE-family HTH domain
MPLNNRIAEAITVSGKSSADIARACGVTAAAVTHWKNGNTKSLKAETALALEQATGFRAVWLLKGKGPRKVEDPSWPFPKVPIERVLALAPDDRGYVQRRLIQSLQEVERDDPGP